MITLVDLKKAITELLKNKYAYPVYGNDVVEGYSKPSFFVEIKPINLSNITKSQRYSKYSLHITYFQNPVNEVDNLKKADEIKELIGMKVKVNQRFLQTDNYDFDFIGDKKILQLNFSVEYFEKQEKHEKNQKAGKIYYRTKEV